MMAISSTSAFAATDSFISESEYQKLVDEGYIEKSIWGTAEIPVKSVGFCKFIPTLLALLSNYFFNIS